MKILIADDYQPILETLCNLLNPYYEVHTCLNGKDLLNMLKENSFNLLILDIMMPKFNGFEILDYIKYLDIPILIFSAQVNIIQNIHQYNIPIIQYLNKPFEIKNLLFQVRQLLNVHLIYKKYQFLKKEFDAQSLKLIKIKKFITMDRDTYQDTWDLLKKAIPIHLIKSQTQQNLVKKQVKILNKLFNIIENMKLQFINQTTTKF